MTANRPCPFDCGFFGTEDQVDDHLSYLVRIDDPDHKTELESAYAESERRRKSIAHLLAWKTAALAMLTDEEIALIDRVVAEKNLPV